MRQALLADENVGKMAEDPKKMAFLRAIEDREDDDDLDFLDRPNDESFVVASSVQDDTNSQSQPSSEPGLTTLQDQNTKARRPMQETDPNMRPPANARRTPAVPMTKKPATLAEIRESVSFLTEAPGAMQVPDPSSSASEDERDAVTSANRAGHSHPCRTVGNPVIDRLSLKRASSTSISADTAVTSFSSTTSRLAFYAPDVAGTGGSAAGGGDGVFKVPSLLRRATTQLTNVDANGISHHHHQHAATERAAGTGDAAEGGFGATRKGGSKKSSVNYFAREVERKRKVEGLEKRRRLELERKATERRGSGLGGLVGGGFD